MAEPFRKPQQVREPDEWMSRRLPDPLADYRPYNKMLRSLLTLDDEASKAERAQ